MDYMEQERQERLDELYTLLIDVLTLYYEYGYRHYTDKKQHEEALLKIKEYLYSNKKDNITEQAISELFPFVIEFVKNSTIQFELPSEAYDRYGDTKPEWEDAYSYCHDANEMENEFYSILEDFYASYLEFQEARLDEDKFIKKQEDIYYEFYEELKRNCDHASEECAAVADAIDWEEQKRDLLNPKNFI